MAMGQATGREPVHELWPVSRVSYRMKMVRVLAIVGVTALASCTGDMPAGLGAAQAAAPPVGTTGVQAATPNSLPDSFTNQDTLNSGAGVVGVTHLPP